MRDVSSTTPLRWGGVDAFAHARDRVRRRTAIELADPSHEEHEQMLEWLGLERAGEFDPAACDVDAVNAAL